MEPIATFALALTTSFAPASTATAEAAPGPVVASPAAVEARAQASPPVGPGDTGTLVTYWQDRLNDWIALAPADLEPIAVDGVYGPDTEATTIAFQQASQAVPVDADGIVDPVDRVALRDEIARLEAADGDQGAPPVARGDTGTLVTYWQDRLNDWIALAPTDLEPIAVDGVFGPNTEATTIAFQQASQAVPVDADGIVDPVDRVALRDEIARLSQELRTAARS